MNEVIIQRLDSLRKVMEEENIDFYLMPTADFHNSEYVDNYFKVREYFCNFSGSNGTLVVSKEEAGMWTDGRYFIQAENEMEGTGVTLYKMLEEGVPTIAEYLEEKMAAGQTLGFDGRVVDTKFGEKLEKNLKKKNVKLSIKNDLAERIWTDRPALPCHPVMILPEDICGFGVDEKLKKVREKMKEKECQYLMLSKLDDLMWLLNIRGKDIECNPVALSYAFITMEETHLFIQQDEVTMEFMEYAGKHNIQIKEYNQVIPFLEVFNYQGKVMLDKGNISFLLYKTISEKAETVDTDNPTELLKAVKSPVELANMEKVYIQDSVAVTKFIYWLKSQVGKQKLTEVDASDYLDHLRSQIEGYLDLSFPTISGYKENAAMMHYEATKEKCKELKPEGMLLVDSGGQYLGGTTDVTRTIVLGPISDTIKKHYSAVTAGMLQLTNANFLYGCTGRNVDILARKPLWDMGIDYKCGTGHGVGYILNVHEGPQGLRWRFTEGMKEAILEEGMDVTNEPGVYIEGSHGIRIENVMVVRKGVKNGDGQFMRFDTLTYVPIDREALDKKYLSKEDINNINEYHKNVYEKINPFLENDEKKWLKKVTRPL